MMDMLKFDILASSQASPAFDGLRADLSRTRGDLALVTTQAVRTKNSLTGIGGALSAEASAAAMSTELDRLRAKYDPVFAASKKYEMQLQDLNRAHKLGAISAQGYEQALERLNADFNKTATGVGRSANAATAGVTRFSGALRAVPLQLSQVAQQGAATGQWMQALTIQAADIGLAFGTIGIFAGAAISVLGPVAATMLNLGDDAITSADAMDEASGAMADMRDAAGVSGAALDELRDKYGRNAEAVRDLYQELILLNQQSANNAVQDAIRAAGDEISDVSAALRDFSDARRELLQAQDVEAGGVVGILPSEMQALEDAVTASQERLREEFGLTSAQAYSISEALDEMRTASGPDAAAEAARGLTQAIAAATAEGANLDQPLVDVANTAAAAYAAFSEALEVGNQLSEVGMTYGVPLSQFAGDDVLPPEDRQKPRSTSRRSSAVAARTDPHALEASRIIDATRTAAEKYAAELGDLNELRDMGYLSELQHARAVEALGEALHDSNRTADRFGSAFKSAFLDFADGATTARDAADNLLNSLSNLALNAAFDAFVAPFANDLLGSILPDSGASLLGPVAGARADGGPVSAGLTYLVGERGPELFQPSGSGRIVPNHDLGRAAPVVNMPITIHNEASNQVGVDVDRSSDGIRVLIREQVRGMIGSGEMDQPMSRFGVRPMARGR
mgnify:CR=1 FL=1